MMTVRAHGCGSKRAVERVGERECEHRDVQVSSNRADVRARTPPVRPHALPHAQLHAFSSTSTHTCPRVQDVAI